MDDDELHADIKKYPDDYQYERAVRLFCSAESYWLCIKTFRNYSGKKTLQHSQAKESLRSAFTKVLDQLQQKTPHCLS
ncbi:hypothetical protein [Acinetobacter boissieri]|uniref:hypothetical protein n=1 Tax=Acinetobacter boissieri TaxID=1219383 RepID=UPI003CC7A5BF